MDGRIQFKYASCGREFFKSATKNIRIQKYPDRCGQGLREAKDTVVNNGYSYNYSFNSVVA